jgi:pimeloyl-ACP methyl ester carboxylesterase
MWTAVALWTLMLGGTAAYVGWAAGMAAHGTPLWLLIVGAPLVYLALILAFAIAYFAVAWRYRAERPPQARIGVAATLRLFANEYRALAGTARRMMLYRWLLNDPPPARVLSPVLLVHGVLCNAGVWLKLSRYLAAHGVHPVYTISYGPPLSSIDTFAEQLAAKIDAITAATGARSVVIVSHSMGGLVALAYCRKYGAEKVRRLISLGAPYHGSMHAWFFPGLCLEQLRPGNRWLDDLHRAPFAWPPISSIWSWHDSMVAPQTSSRIPGADNIALIGVGHNAMLADRAVASNVLALIKSTVSHAADYQ